MRIPTRLLKGRISNIGPILDPNVRTAKVRVEVDNPQGLMRIGMFVTASFQGQKKERFAVVPATAICTCMTATGSICRPGTGNSGALEVRAGANLPNKMQAISSGLDPGQEVVTNALVMQNTTEE